MPETPTFQSGSFWFRRRRLLLLALVVVVIAVVVVAVRSTGSARGVRPDLGPGPVRGVRLTEFQPGEGDQSCPGVGADLPVVRLVAQVDVEQLTICLGPGRRADSFPLESFVLDATTDDGARILDAWAAAWSLGDQQVPWWQNPEDVACPTTAFFNAPVAITVDGVTVRPIPPWDACQPLPEALAALDEVTQAARPA
jgi:hypothetical protein